MFQIIGAMAEFRTFSYVERVKAGIATPAQKEKG